MLVGYMPVMMPLREGADRSVREDLREPHAILREVVEHRRACVRVAVAAEVGA